MRFHTFGLGRGVSALLAALSAAYLNNIKARLWRNLNRWGRPRPSPPTFITDGTHISISMHIDPNYFIALQMDSVHTFANYVYIGVNSATHPQHRQQTAQPTLPPNHHSGFP